MVGPRYTNSLSFGTVLTLIALIGGGIYTQAYVDSRSSANEAAIERLEAERRDSDLRLRVLENNFARADERYGTLLAVTTRMDARLERIERRGEEADQRERGLTAPAPR